MLKKIFGFLSKAKQTKDAVARFIEIAERADDDLDADGKAEYQNILEESNTLGNAIWDDAKGVFADIVLRAKEHYQVGLRIVERAQKLIKHVEAK